MTSATSRTCLSSISVWLAEGPRTGSTSGSLSKPNRMRASLKRRRAALRGHNPLERESHHLTLAAHLLETWEPKPLGQPDSRYARSVIRQIRKQMLCLSLVDITSLASTVQSDVTSARSAGCASMTSSRSTRIDVQDKNVVTLIKYFFHMDK